MKILKLLNKKNLTIVIIYLFSTLTVFAEDKPIDIWNIDKKENKIIAHIAVLLTLIILLALVGMRLPKSIDQGGIGLIRVILMIGTSALSMIYFVKSFIANRKKA